MLSPPTLIVILGPTACGKTRLAALLAHQIDGEVISADSRQVYRRMNLGTGKDYSDYVVNGHSIPFHLIDIAEPNEEYNLFRYQKDYVNALTDVVARGKCPILCGGTGLYIESVLSEYQLCQVPRNEALRERLAGQSQDQLAEMLFRLRPLHNTTDTRDRERTLRAIEIALSENTATVKNDAPALGYISFGVNPGREVVRQRITDRLQQRLHDGLVEEVRQLLSEGIEPARMEYFGLEYRYLTRYLLGKLSYNHMVKQLNTAIHQFAKRQMTWFRRMERRGIRICWIDNDMSDPEKVAYIIRTTGV